MRGGRVAGATAAVGLVMVVLVALVSGARAVLSADSLNATRALAVPTWLDEVTRRGAIAYPAHSALGTVLEAAGLSPAATAMQWFKASHARSDAELELAARGIVAALARDGHDGRALRTLCTVKDLANPDQASVIGRIDPRCDRWPSKVALEAVAAPTCAKAGSAVSIAVWVTSATDYAGLVDVEIYDGGGRRIAQWVFADQQLIADRRQPYTVEWQIPSSLPTGQYEVRLGVFSDGWTASHGWKNAAATITVAS